MALAHAILASILDSPTTGYDLAKRFGTDGYLWRATHQQIYGELKRLEQAGMIEPATETTGPRRNRPVAITDAGRKQLIEWVHQPTAPASIKEDMLVKCLTLSLVSRTELAQQIAERRTHHQRRLGHYQAAAARSFPHVSDLTDAELGRYLALTGGINYERQWIRWANTSIGLLTGHHADATSPSESSSSPERNADAAPRQSSRAERKR
jgi:DNA-binding PadR family transcriptional regulator